MPPERKNLTMEKNLEILLTETMNEPGVTGILCIDSQGLPLAAKGTANKRSSGPVSCLVQEASLINPDQPNPVITLEGETSNLLIKAQDKITIAIHKVKS